MNVPRPRFHLAFQVHDLGAARWFYGTVLGCPEGRSGDRWVDFDLFGHQIVAHLDPAAAEGGRRIVNPVDGHDVPVPHFGVLLDPETWATVAGRLVDADVEIVVEPHTRFAGLPGEQSTIFVLDPSGNALEFKAFGDDSTVFAR